MKFKDVKDDDWGRLSIEAVADAGIMGGYPDGTFMPDGFITRREQASIEYRRLFRNGIFEKGIIDKVLASTVLIRTDTNAGSGVCIGATKEGKRLILTNRHVVKENKTFALTKGGFTFTGTVHIVSAVPDEDLALIATDSNVFPALSLAASPAAVGEPVAVVGSPALMVENVTVGIVSHIDRGGGRFGLDAAINPGNSGGPIVNEKGEVVGIAVAKVVGMEYEGLGFGIKLDIIRGFLERVK